MSRSSRTLTGLALVVGGALVGLLALTVLPWYRSNFGGFLNFGTKAPDLRRTISFYRDVPDLFDAIDFGVAPLYFGWLAVTLLLVAALTGAISLGLDGRASRAAGLLGALFGLAGAVLTVLAIRPVIVDGAKLGSKPPTYGDFVAQSSVGAWAALLSYLAVGIGAMLAAGGRQTLRELLSDEPDEPDEPVADEVAPAPVPPERDAPKDW